MVNRGGKSLVDMSAYSLLTLISPSCQHIWCKIYCNILTNNLLTTKHCLSSPSKFVLPNLLFDPKTKHLSASDQFYSVWLIFFYFNMSSHMLPQIVCPRGYITTLITFVRLFSTVSSHMRNQIAWLNEGIVTLLAFVQLFSCVCF